MSPDNKESYSRYKKYTTDLRRYYRLPAVQTSLSVVLSLFVVAFFILVAIRPTLITIAKLNKTIEESQKTLDQLTKKAAALNQITKIWEEISPLEKYIESSIPSDGPHYQSLTRAMELLAGENGVKLTTLMVGDALTYSKLIDPYTGIKRTVVEMPFSLRVSGGYPEISRFLTGLTQIDRLIAIESIAFSKDAKTGENELSISISLTGTVSYLADETLLNNILGEKKGSK